MVPKVCSFEDCTKPFRARGYCVGHYQQLSDGRPIRPILRDAPLEDRFWAKVDKSGECWEWTGAKTQQGYPRFGGNDYGHRMSWSMENGPIPPKGEIDHTCHNPGCVKPAHLRLATRKQNIENHSGPKKSNKSGVRGVCLNKRGRWEATVRHDGVIHRVGAFKLLADAEVAVLAKRKELHTFNDADRALGSGA